MSNSLKNDSNFVLHCKKCGGVAVLELASYEGYRWESDKGLYSYRTYEEVNFISMACADCKVTETIDNNE